MESRKVNMSFFRSGQGYYHPRVNIPVTWAKVLDVTKENKEVEIFLDAEKKEIIIKKVKTGLEEKEEFIKNFLELSDEELNMLLEKRKVLKW